MSKFRFNSARSNEDQVKMPARPRAEPLTIDILRAKMERAYEIAKERDGTTLQAIGRSIGFSKTLSAQHTYQLMHMSENPGVLLLERFANATGLSLIELLQLPINSSSTKKSK